MSGVFKELWPFFKEIIFHNKDIKRDLSDPKSVLKTSGILTLVLVSVYILYIVFNELLINTYTRNTMLSENVIRLEESYQETVKNNRILENSLSLSTRDRMRLEETLLESTLTINRFKKVNATMGRELEMCLDRERSGGRTTTPREYGTQELHMFLRGL